MKRTLFILWGLSLITLVLVLINRFYPPVTINDPGYKIGTNHFQPNLQDVKYYLTGDPTTSQYFLSSVESKTIQSVPIKNPEIANLSSMINRQVTFSGKIGHSNSTLKCQLLTNCPQLIILSQISPISEVITGWADYQSRFHFQLHYPPWLFPNLETCSGKLNSSCKITWQTLPPTPQYLHLTVSSPQKTVKESDLPGDSTIINEIKWIKKIVDQPNQMSIITYSTIYEQKMYQFSYNPSQSYLIASNIDRILSTFKFLE